MIFVYQTFSVPIKRSEAIEGIKKLIYPIM